MEQGGKNSAGHRALTWEGTLRGGLCEVSGARPIPQPVMSQRGLHRDRPYSPQEDGGE